MINEVACTLEEHGQAILDIFNDAIEHSTALYDLSPRGWPQMVSWFDAKAQGGFPVIGLSDEEGTLMGFATYGTFRAFAAYQHTVEHSVYVHRDHRGKGLGRTLLQKLIQQARAQGLHLMVGVIDSDNEVSIALHRQMGFEHAGTLKEAGRKFDRWLDVAIYQLNLAAQTEVRDKADASHLR